jgi:putative N6-adenine-specific DNA methylase
MAETGWQRRVKRHIIGKSHDFFVIAGPGLAQLCADQLRNIVDDSASVAVISGGAGFRGRLTDAYRANLHLRYASRVLMRLATIEATHFNALQHQVSQFPWELYLSPDHDIDVRVAAHRCKLIHSQAIGQRVRAGIQQRRQLPLDAGHGKPDQKIYVRGVNDRFVFSLDSSGENLYRRGFKPHGGRAPLRETLAAAVLQLAGYDPEQWLVDPMCGSGTFSLEAALIATRTPPGWQRDFAFFNWPAFRPGHWAYLKAECQKKIQPAGQTLIWASDCQKAACRRLRQAVSRLHLSSAIRVESRDFFELMPPGAAGLVVINPPYGRRLGDKGNAQMFYDRIGAKLKTDFKGWRYAVIAPNAAAAQSLGLQGRSFRLWHGGLWIEVQVGGI